MNIAHAEAGQRTPAWPPERHVVATRLTASSSVDVLHSDATSMHQVVQTFLHLQRIAVRAQGQLGSVDCRTGHCRVEITSLQVVDDSASLALSRTLPRGTVLAKLAEANWRKELFLVATVVRGMSVIVIHPICYADVVCATATPANASRDHKVYQPLPIVPF